MIARARAMQWLLGVSGGVLALFVFTIWLADNFPQQYATQFYQAKAVIGTVAVVLTVLHMDRTWDHLRSGAQMSRYIMLLFGAVVAGGGSFEQIKDGASVQLTNIGGMEFLIGVIIAMIWSLREDVRHYHAHHC